MCWARPHTKAVGSTSRPTHRSETAKPTMRTLEGECKEGVLHIEASTREFPTTAEMEVRTSTMQMKMKAGVVALAWNSSPETPQQQVKSFAVIDEELLYLVSMSTARNWRKSTFALLYRTRELSTLNGRSKLEAFWTATGTDVMALNKCEAAGFDRT